MHQKISNRRTSAQWQNLIDQQQESGVNQKGFCELNNICLSTFTLWKRKLAQTAVIYTD
ncbi:IS66 family insertion sequence element accessory protein TnpA [Endozoicomonas sp. ALB091]|uniref:IS66 family insertion sequence element accessory protein TnpA n=1 Tax=Endozoicomonas sp. ALB091 TaxID=3403073 RepID=UPI003BB7C8FB